MLLATTRKISRQSMVQFGFTLTTFCVLCFFDCYIYFYVMIDDKYIQEDIVLTLKH